MQSFEIIVIPQFQKEFKQLIKKYPSILTDLGNLIKLLEQNPLTGTPLGNNCYKIRMNIGSKRTGKRGGARVITCVKIINKKVYLISIYDKADKENVTKKEIEAILKLAGII